MNVFFPGPTRAHRRPRAALVALALAAAMPLAGLAAPAADDPTQLSLEQLLDLDVQSASKFTQKASEAPASVTVISAADIRTYGYRTLADVLNAVRGLYVHGDRNYSYLGVRGFGPLGSYNARVLVMVDGYRLNDPIYGQGSIGREFPVDVDLIDRVEFVPGPGSAIYGSNAFFGVINVITREGRALQGLEVAAEGGSHRAARGRVSWGARRDDGAELLLSATRSVSRGPDLFFPEFAVPGVSDGMARGLDHEQATNLLLKGRLGGFTLEAAQGARSKGVPTASFQTIFGNPDEHTHDTQSFVELRYEGELARRTQLAARVNAGRYDYRGDYPVAGALPGTVVRNVDLASSRWWGGELKVVGRVGDSHKVVLGAEYQRNTRKNQDNFDLEPAAVYIHEHHRATQEGVYVQDEITLRPDLVLNAGLRHDHYSTFGGIDAPRLALIYTPRPSLTLKGLYGQAFRAPTDGELFFSSVPLGWKGNPQLRPERITTRELVLEWRLASLTRATLSAFRYRIGDLITLHTDPVDGQQQYRNDGIARVSGLQGEFEQLWSDGSAVRASYSHQRAVDAGDAWLVNSPRHVAKLDASTPLWRQALRAGVTLRYTSDLLTRSGVTVGGQCIVGVTLSSDRLVPHGVLSASLYNLSNRRYVDPVSDAHVQDTVDQDRRTLRVQLVLSY